MHLKFAPKRKKKFVQFQNCYINVTITFFYPAVRNERGRPRNFRSNWETVDNWRWRARGPTNVASGLCGGSETGGNLHQRQQHQQQQQPHVLAGNWFLYNITAQNPNIYIFSKIYKKTSGFKTSKIQTKRLVLRIQAINDFYTVNSSWLYS